MTNSPFEKLTAVVTGGGSGIGKAIAERLAVDKLHVAVLDLDLDAADEVAEEIQESGGSAQAIQCDVSDLRSVRRAFASIKSLEILVNNAGIASIGDVLNTTPTEFDRIYAVNVKGVYHCLQLAIPRMLERGRGVIVNMASIASNLGIAERFAYSMSKGAVQAMTLSVAKDFVEQGIRCNCVCPARVHTPFVDGYLEANYSEEKERSEKFVELSKFQPLGRMAQPEEVASLVGFLCSPDADFITGSSYDIDGGVSHLR